MDTAVVPFDPDAIIDRIASGTFTRTIANELGIARSTLQQRLATHPRYPEAIREQAGSLVEKSTEELMAEELPADSAAIARARARVDAAHRWAAARDPERWAPKGQTITINTLITVDASLGTQAGELLDKLRQRNAVDVTPAQHSEELPKE